jgi:heme/copper-type cytochrome/quinol oxidase subunit 4
VTTVNGLKKSIKQENDSLSVLSHLPQSLTVASRRTMNGFIVFAFLTAVPFIVAMPYFLAEEGQGKRSA